MTRRPTSRSSRRPAPRLRRALATAACLPLLAVTACGGGDPEEPVAEPSPTLPTGTVEVPDGIDLTPAGTELAFGEKATVAYEPNPERSSVLEMSVDSVQTGRIADFASYQLDDRTKASTPYYVRATVTNVGQGDVGGTGVPLLAVDTRDTLIQPSSFTNTFAACPSTPLPTPFAATATAATCLVYLVPEGAQLTGMSFRPLQAYEPIEWKGAVAPPVTPTPKPKKKRNG